MAPPRTALRGGAVRRTAVTAATAAANTGPDRMRPSRSSQV
ncbi:hypothetical protein [Streptomyces sp. ISL-100]|nr:hypothetical protein [Streptomyces sp. ISL-100]